MEPTKADQKAARNNPWGLTVCQCMTLRLVCEHGSSKRAAYHTDISHKLIEHHLHKARKAMGFFGVDVRLFLNWDRWTNEQSTKDRDTRAVARQTLTKGPANEND